MTQPILLLFDIDGTLLLTNGAGMRAMHMVAAEMFGSHFSWEGVSTGGNLDPLIYAQALAVNRIEHDEAVHDSFRSQYLVMLRHELERSAHSVWALPGIHDVVRALVERERTQGDVIVGMLTANYTDAAPIKLAAVGLDVNWFSLTVFGDEGRTRPDLVALAMRKYQARVGVPANPKRVLVIGDTPRDVDCAHAHGCVALGVATGHHTAEELQAAGADMVAPDLSDPSPLLRWIEQA